MRAESDGCVLERFAWPDSFNGSAILPALPDIPPPLYKEGKVGAVGLRPVGNVHCGGARVTEFIWNRDAPEFVPVGP